MIDFQTLNHLYLAILALLRASLFVGSISMNQAAGSRLHGDRQVLASVAGNALGVSDNGPGVPPELVDQIVDLARSDKDGGMGIDCGSRSTSSRNDTTACCGWTRCSRPEPDL